MAYNFDYAKLAVFFSLSQMSHFMVNIYGVQPRLRKIIRFFALSQMSHFMVNIYGVQLRLRKISRFFHSLKRVISWSPNNTDPKEDRNPSMIILYLDFCLHLDLYYLDSLWNSIWVTSIPTFQFKNCFQHLMIWT